MIELVSFIRHSMNPIRRVSLRNGIVAAICLAMLAGTGAVAPQAVAQETGAPAGDAISEQTIDFNRDIQPIFARRCFSCHGPADREAGLRLDEREAALARLESGETAIVPGDPAESALLARITSDEEFTRMPPEGEPLSAEEIERIRTWIAEGAEWGQHWAFDPPRAQTPPDVQDREWVQTPIDAFILHRLEANGLTPAPPADKVSLLRRLYYNLTGLPPTPEEVEEFLTDESPDAYEKVVDRLLDSPRYGEKWARHWLDLVRFAETNSYERDGLKPHAWRFRDYVIRSLNEDKPYDQFLREQLAGDELDTPTADSIIATGFYRLGIWDDEPVDRVEAKFDGLDDIVRTTGEAFLGLTIGCARCHDHKVDPISQADYYSFLAFFHGLTPMAYGGAQVERPVFRTDDDRQQFEQAVRDLQQRRDQTQAKLTAIENEFREKAELSSALANDLDDLEYRYYRDTWDRLPDFDNLKPETVGKPEKPYFDIRLADRPESFGFVFTGILKVPEDGEYTFTLDSDDGSRLTIDGQTIIEYDGIHGVGEPKSATVQLKQGRRSIRLDYFQGRFGKGLEVSWSGPGFERRYLSATTARGEDLSALAGKNIHEQLNVLGASVFGQEQVEEYNRLREELEKLKREKAPAEYALCVTEVGPHAPETFVLLRGNAHAHGEKVEPAFPTILGGGFPDIPSPEPEQKTSGRRRVLADWIASPDNPMTSRVMVNRIWQFHFGRGIVRSTNNFGQLGDLPTHPELLDWLAEEFVRQGWSLKAMHKLLVMSNAYQMSSQADPDALRKDPENDLFWRFNMRRLTAEEIRDSIHAINGRLNLKMYGPGIYPKISREVLAGQSQPGAGWGQSSPEERARRSVYIHVKRSLITPILANFDFPETDISCEGRFTTTHPGQALGLLNGEFTNEQAVHFADRLRREAGENRELQVRLALHLALSHTSEEEVQRGLALIDKLQNEHELDEQTALNYYCLVVLNLNEFLYLD